MEAPAPRGRDESLGAADFKGESAACGETTTVSPPPPEVTNAPGVAGPIWGRNPGASVWRGYADLAVVVSGGPVS